MSKVMPFMVGLAVSGMSYAYVSRQVVTSRNQLMTEHLGAKDSELYYPVRRVSRLLFI